MQLREWQTGLQRHILEGGDAPATRAGGADAARRLAVYADAYVLRLDEALRGNFPALHRLLGDADCLALTRRYLRAHPPHTASIRWFGDALADFLALAQPYADCPAMAELARFEWALRHALDAADGEPVGADALAAVPPSDWGALRFGLHPSVTLLGLRWNTPAIWRALDRDEEPPAPCAQAAHWIVYRGAGLEAAWRSLGPGEADALARLRDGDTFAAVCETAAGAADDAQAAALTAARWLRDWISAGLLVPPTTAKFFPSTC